MSQTHPSIIKRTRVPFAKNSKSKIDLKKGEIIEIIEGGSQCDKMGRINTTLVIIRPFGQKWSYNGRILPKKSYFKDFRT